MIITLDEATKIVNGVHPCSCLYNCFSGKEFMKIANEMKNIKDLIKFVNDMDEVNNEKFLNANVWSENWTDEKSADCKKELVGIQKANEDAIRKVLLKGNADEA